MADRWAARLARFEPAPQDARRRVTPRPKKHRGSPTSRSCCLGVNSIRRRKTRPCASRRLFTGRVSVWLLRSSQLQQGGTMAKQFSKPSRSWRTGSSGRSSETGCFYPYATGESRKTLGALNVLSGPCSLRAADVQVRWAEDGSVVGLLISGRSGRRSTQSTALSTPGTTERASGRPCPTALVPL